MIFALGTSLCFEQTMPKIGAALFLQPGTGHSWGGAFFRFFLRPLPARGASDVTKLASFGAFVGLQHDIDGLVHISQISEDRVDKIKNVLKVGQEVTARVIKIDKSDRRIGLSIKAANYSQEQLKAEQAALDALKPGEDLVALQHAFDAADEAVKDEPKE